MPRTRRKTRFFLTQAMPQQGYFPILIEPLTLTPNTSPSRVLILLLLSTLTLTDGGMLCCEETNVMMVMMMMMML